MNQFRNWMLLIAAVNAAKCTEKDCCVPPPGCNPGDVCPAVCYINTNCEGEIFNICKAGGPTISLPSATTATGLTIPPKPTATLATTAATTSTVPTEFTTTVTAGDVLTSITSAFIYAIYFLF